MRLIYADDAIYELKREFPADDFGKIIRCISRTPTVNVQEVKHGTWTEKEVIHKDEAKEIFEEWQSCRCSVCGRYDTRPYLYYFDNPNYCSFCGVKMNGKETEDAEVH